MNINQVKTAFKIADVKYTKNETKLNFSYLTDLKDENGNLLPQSILRENVARVYLIVVDGEIYKIGGSQDKGGMKGTLNIYQDGGIKGRPSIRSFGVWYFLYHTILEGKKIEFYMIYQDNFEAEVKGLFGYKKVPNASLNYKLIEQCCEEDYQRVSDGAYPQWNVQEQAGDWPSEIKEQHAQILKKSSNKKIKNGRKEVKRT